MMATDKSESRLKKNAANVSCLNGSGTGSNSYNKNKTAISPGVTNQSNNRAANNPHNRCSPQNNNTSKNHGNT
eukprot:Awhi_evm1s1108